MAAVVGLIYNARLRKRISRLEAWAHTPKFDAKWQEFSECDPSKLLVITDFDATVTAGDSEQCHDLMGCNRLISMGFRKECAPLLDWENNSAIDGVEWWDTMHGLMVKHGQPSRPMLPRIVSSAKIKLRPGARELLGQLAKLGVPVLIVSAGLSDVIEEFLRQQDLLSDNITVCSNRLNYGADSAPQSVSPEPPITSFTKANAYKMAAAFFRHHKERRMVLCLGDSVTDIDAAQEVPYDSILSVGFLNSKPATAMKKYADTFDAVVLGNDGSLEPLSMLLSSLVDRAAQRTRTLKQSKKRSESFSDLVAALKGA